MIIWEFISGVPPFDDRPHNIQLSLSICKGERPEIIKNIPECYTNLMKKCWDSDLLKRPKASEIENIFDNWRVYPDIYHGGSIYIDSNNIKENIDEIIQEEMNGIDESLKNDIKEFWKSEKALAQENDSDSI